MLPPTPIFNTLTPVTFSDRIIVLITVLSTRKVGKSRRGLSLFIQVIYSGYFFVWSTGESNLEPGLYHRAALPASKVQLKFSHCLSESFYITQ